VYQNCTRCLSTLIGVSSDAAGVQANSASNNCTTDESTATAVCFKATSTQRQLTIMLVTICCAAICLQLPYTILYLINAAKDELWPDEHNHVTLHANLYLSMRVADMLATANHAVNFALYCVSGSLFRRGVRRLCRPAAHRQLHREGAKHDTPTTRIQLTPTHATGSTGVCQRHAEASPSTGDGVLSSWTWWLGVWQWFRCRIRRIFSSARLLRMPSTTLMICAESDQPTIFAKAGKYGACLPNDERQTDETWLKFQGIKDRWEVAKIRT